MELFFRCHNDLLKFLLAGHPFFQGLGGKMEARGRIACAKLPVRLKSSCVRDQFSDNNNSQPAGRQARGAVMGKKARS